MNAKHLADAITFARAAGALALAVSALTPAPAPLAWAAAFMLADWAGDMLDGALARRSPRACRTWIGDHDLEVDMWVAACLLAYLALTGRVGVMLAAGYSMLSLALLALTDWPRSLGMLLQAPIYLGFIIITGAEAPAAGLCLALWPVVAILLTWPKFHRVVVPEFLAGMRRLRTAGWLRGAVQRAGAERLNGGGRRVPPGRPSRM